MFIELNTEKGLCFDLLTQPNHPDHSFTPVREQEDQMGFNVSGGPVPVNNYYSTDSNQTVAPSQARCQTSLRSAVTKRPVWDLNPT